MGIFEKFSLQGKSAYITGGARGIGKSIAKALLEAGAKVAIADIDLAEAENTAAGFRLEGMEAVAVHMDVSDEDSVVSCIGAIVSKFGGIDVAVNNAGICINVPAAEMSLADWSKVISINLTGVFLTAQAAGRQMIKQGHGGSIINIASMSAHVVNTPQPQCAYNASKAGVIQLSKSLAVEWVDHGIRVNTISPGYIGTELTLNSPSLKPLIASWEAATPMKRMGKPEELQAIALYLASDAASFTTGSDFTIDGAFTCI